MGSETYHEPYDVLSPKLREMHRALWSLIEELEAIDWYAQRAEVTDDAELKAVLLHNRAEEIEHAMMNLEWIRRNDALFDKNMTAPGGNQALASVPHLPGVVQDVSEPRDPRVPTGVMTGFTRTVSG